MKSLFLLLIIYNLQNYVCSSEISAILYKSFPKKVHPGQDNMKILNSGVYYKKLNKPKTFTRFHPPISAWPLNKQKAHEQRTLPDESNFFPIDTLGDLKSRVRKLPYFVDSRRAKRDVNESKPEGTTKLSNTQKNEASKPKEDSQTPALLYKPTETTGEKNASIARRSDIKNPKESSKLRKSRRVKPLRTGLPSKVLKTNQSKVSKTSRLRSIGKINLKGKRGVRASLRQRKPRSRVLRANDDKKPKKEDGADKAPKEKAGADKAPKEKAGADKAPKEKAGADKAPKEKAGADKAPKEKAGADKAPKEKTKADKERKGKPGLDKTPKKKASNDKAHKEKTVNTNASKVKPLKGKTGNEKAPEVKAENQKAPKGKSSNDKKPNARAVTDEGPKENAKNDNTPKDRAGDAKSPKEKANNDKLPKQKTTDVKQEAPKGKTGNAAAKVPRKRRASSVKRNLKASGRRLISARDAAAEDYPYVISIQKNNEHWCSGAILNPQLIISTANCFWKSRAASRMKVRAGAHTADTDGQVANIAEVRKHPKWSIRKFPEHDIALALLDRQLRFDHDVHGVDLPNKVMIPPFNDAWVTSYGSDRRDGVFNRQRMTLQVSHMRMMPDQKCADTVKRFGVPLHHSFFCLEQTGRRAPCTRDTGAPAVSDGILWGLASWGIRKLCGTQRFPAMFSYTADQTNMDFIINATSEMMGEERNSPFLDRHPPQPRAIIVLPHEKRYTQPDYS